jgi:4-nitrophenyl phosphatase
MLDKLSPPVRGLILDMDGVLWRDDSPIGDLPAIFNRIQARGLKATLATNNATKTVDEYLDKLCNFGVTLEPWQIVTAANALAHMFSELFPDKGAVFVIGENGLVSALKEKGFIPITDPDDATRVVAVVSSWDRQLTFQKLRRATLHIRAGAPFYATNADKSFPTPEGLIPGAGAILAALENATDVKAAIIGKPSPFMQELAAERMGLTKEEVLVVGDRLDSDIAGGQAMSARTALVLSGVATRVEADAWNPKPDLIANDLAELVK